MGTILTEKKHLSLIGKALKKADKMYPNANVDSGHLAAFAHEYMILLEQAVIEAMFKVIEDFETEKKAKLN